MEHSAKRFNVSTFQRCSGSVAEAANVLFVFGVALPALILECAAQIGGKFIKNGGEILDRRFTGLVTKWATLHRSILIIHRLVLRAASEDDNFVIANKGPQHAERNIAVR